ncbi:hypothetical protein CCUS01_07367 [Colletotrichum cuscutae]|uniref:Uncharacterized protein n=1 Tax=Colletotrichum cuscutae TaxID=1209917 RepID=A0AAI9Y0S7_9PEZI|nr:hypothetical protein CCUS01_07367 [Colletotrichum cuscutae]
MELGAFKLGLELARNISRHQTRTRRCTEMTTDNDRSDRATEFDDPSSWSRPGRANGSLPSALFRARSKSVQDRLAHRASRNSDRDIGFIARRYPAAGEMKVECGRLDPSASNRGIGTSKDSGASPICSPAYGLMRVCELDAETSMKMDTSDAELHFALRTDGRAASSCCSYCMQSRFPEYYSHVSDAPPSPGDRGCRRGVEEALDTGETGSPGSWFEAPELHLQGPAKGMFVIFPIPGSLETPALLLSRLQKISSIDKPAFGLGPTLTVSMTMLITWALTISRMDETADAIVNPVDIDRPTLEKKIVYGSHPYSPSPGTPRHFTGRPTHPPDSKPPAAIGALATGLQCTWPSVKAVWLTQIAMSSLSDLMTGRRLGTIQKGASNLVTKVGATALCLAPWRTSSVLQDESPFALLYQSHELHANKGSTRTECKMRMLKQQNADESSEYSVSSIARSRARTKKRPKPQHHHATPPSMRHAAQLLIGRKFEKKWAQQKHDMVSPSIYTSRKTRLTSQACVSELQPPRRPSRCKKASITQLPPALKQTFKNTPRPAAPPPRQSAPGPSFSCASRPWVYWIQCQGRIDSDPVPINNRKHLTETRGDSTRRLERATDATEKQDWMARPVCLFARTRLGLRRYQAITCMIGKTGIGNNPMRPKLSA